MRTIRTYGDGPSQAVADAVAGVLVAELLSPSRAVWLVSPWVSDIPVLDNRYGELLGVSGSLPRRLIGLVEVLGILAAQPRCAVTVVTKDVDTNASVIGALSHDVDLVLDDGVHEKALLTDRVLITGSMNFTFGGTARNSEVVKVIADPATIQEAHVQLGDRHGVGA